MNLQSLSVLVRRAGQAVLFASSLAGTPLWARSVDEELARLKNRDAEVRLEALRELMTSLDPRLLEALLPLLADEGNSVRRLAARAVGSRWWQIPAERRGEYLKALARHEKSEFEDEVNMVRRAEGLLSRSYGGALFQRSPDKRWVIYERRGLPCLIDTANGTEELLGWREGDAPSLYGGASNGTLEESVVWHPSSRMAAFGMSRGRRDSAVWFWRLGGAVVKLGQEEILPALKVRPGSFLQGGGFYVQLGEWKGDECSFSASYTVRKGEDFDEREVTLGYNPRTKALRVLKR